MTTSPNDRQVRPWCSVSSAFRGSQVAAIMAPLADRSLVCDSDTAVSVLGGGLLATREARAIAYGTGMTKHSAVTAILHTFKR